MRSTCLLALCLAAVAPAQDMIAVTYSGSIYGVDSMNGDTSLIAPGLFGLNAMAQDRTGTLWTVSRTLLGSPLYFLTRLDPDSFEMQIVAPCGDLRELADAGNGELFAIEFFPGDSRLVLLDTATGARTAIGQTGQDIEGLAVLQGTLYAWSVQEGLGTLDPATGAFTDIGPFGGSQSVLWLTVRPDGQLIGGGTSLFEIDPVTGVRTLYATGSVELRGAAASGMVLPYGAGCEGVQLTGSGSLRPGSLLTTRSTGYPSTGALVGIAGALIFGTSRTSFQGIALPLNLDPLLGTEGCFLHASVDVSELNFTTGGAAPSLFFPIQIPPTVFDQTFYIQHAGFDILGRTYWSNGIRLYVGL